MKTVHILSKSAIIITDLRITHESNKLEIYVG